MLNAHWRDRPYRALVEALGTPRMTMEVPGNGTKQVAVYGVVDPDSKCIDAFALQTFRTRETVVLEYFCR